MQKTLARIFQAAMLLLLVSLPIAMLKNAAPKPTSAVSSSDIIRLHIIAQDDSLESQALKLKLRDAILERFADPLTGSSFEEASEQISSRISDIEAYSNAALAAFGFAGTCAATFGKEEFPDRTYAGRLVQGGVYDALVIRIGKAQGRNWWCVMYPPLCLLSADTPKTADVAFASINAFKPTDSADSYISNNDSFIYIDRTRLPAPSVLAERRTNTSANEPKAKTTFGNGLFFSAVFEWVKNLF
ncbi:MAG: stage II sporulation protein R [Oscillospiraceae bacterium]|jgi:stage II sporulation protein R|nr:stage II sporulation protein R [Oscillospiraceae bacterium]